MEKKEKKKKKLTLSISSSKIPNVPRYAQSSGKTSVVIEKKAPRRPRRLNILLRRNARRRTQRQTCGQI